MEGSSSGAAASGDGSAKLRLLDLPAENLVQIIAYIPKKSLFPLLVVSHQFHRLASAALYRNLSFNLVQSDGSVRHRDPSTRLASALNTFLTSPYDYAQHVKFFTLRMAETDADHKQKRIASKFLAYEEAGMLLNSSLLVMIRRASSLEQFSWQVPIECSSHVYQALSNVPSLQVLHVHFDILSVTKHSYSAYPPPPPPPGPIFGGNQTTVWWDPMSAGSLQSGSIPSSSGFSKSSKATIGKGRTQSRKLGAIKSLQSLTITAVDDLGRLEEIAACVKASSGSLRTLALSFAETLVSKSQKPNPHNTNNIIHIPEDDATTEPNSPDLNATASAPTDLDLKREKQAQEQALARIFSLDKASASVQKHDKKIEKSLKHTAKSLHLSKTDAAMLDNLAFQILSTIQISTLDSNIKSKVKDLLDAIMPIPVTTKIKPSAKKSKPSATSGKGKWPAGGPNNPAVNPATFGYPSHGFDWGDTMSSPHAGSSKAPQSYIGPPDDFEFGPGTAINNSAGPLLSWDNNNTPLLGSSANAPKHTFPYGEPAAFQASAVKIKPPSVFSSSTPYTYHPNTSSSMINAVSHNIPSSGTIPQLALHSASEPVPVALWSTPPHQHVPQTMIDSAAQSTSITTTQQPDGPKVEFHDPIAQKKQIIQFLHNSSASPEEKLLILENMKTNLIKSHGQSAFKPKKKQAMPTAITPTDSSPESSSDSESGSDQPADPAALVTSGNVDGLEGTLSDFDMDHPDAPDSEGVDDSEDNDMEQTEDTAKVTIYPSKSDDDDVVDHNSKGKERADSSVIHRPTINVPVEDETTNSTTKSPATAPTIEESIQEYIRMTHGLSIQDFTLCFIPLKSSVLAKALDLTVLRRVVLFNVGSQGAFWTMIEKLVDQGTMFNFQTLYTDDVSAAFVSCLGKLSGLKSLHLLRRSSKEFSCTSSKPPANLTDIHRLGLTKHFATLQSLSITNLEDDTWDVDDKLVRAMSSKAKKLRELAFSMISSSFHTFLRCLPGFKSLVALHLINIKVAPTPSPMMPQNEWKKLILDVLCYYPSLKLKYVGIALVNQGRVSQIGDKPKMSIPSWYKKQDESQQQQHQQEEEASNMSTHVGTPGTNSKGKGKAPMNEPSPAPSSTSKVSTNAARYVGNNDVFDSSDADEERPNVYYSKTYRTSALADTYAIYSTLVLRGRLS